MIVINATSPDDRPFRIFADDPDRWVDCPACGGRQTFRETTRGGLAKGRLRLAYDGHCTACRFDIQREHLEELTEKAD